MQGHNENQFQLFGLALGKYTQYTNSVPDIDLGICKVNLNGPVSRRCGQLLYRSSEYLVHFYYLIIHISNLAAWTCSLRPFQRRKPQSE